MPCPVSPCDPRTTHSVTPGWDVPLYETEAAAGDLEGFGPDFGWKLVWDVCLTQRSQSPASLPPQGLNSGAKRP